MRYLLDTDHLSVLQRGSGADCHALTVRLAPLSADEFGLSVISLHEQVLGCHTFLSRARTPAAVVRGYTLLQDVLAAFAIAEVVPFDAAAAEEFDRLAGLRLRVATMDLRIAAVALSRGLILLTRNVRDFGRIPELVTEDWTA